MKKSILTLFSFLLFTSLFSQARLNGAFDYGLFKTSDNITYVEAYLSIFGGTFAYTQNPNGSFSGELEITLVASTQGKMQWYDKYKLNTGEIQAADTSFATLLDTKRFSVPEGVFRLDMVITDLKSKTPNFIEYADSITVGFNSGKPQISTPVLVNKYSPTKTENAFSKAGIDIIPNTTGFFSGEDSVLAFYAEVYETAKYFGESERFVVNHHIKSYESGTIVPGTESITVATVKPIYGALFPISLKNVPPGNYTLVFEVRNKLNEPITRVERVFQRGGKVNMTVMEDLSTVGTDFMARVENPDSLKEFIRCLNPIAMSQEQTFAKNVIKNGDLEMMKKYIVSFWLRRNQSDPYKEWIKYKSQVSLAQKIFGTQYLRAYNTDRGRVFLQYGPPNVRSERPNEPFAYPYEIWQYYELYNPISQMRQTNRTFVFWNRNAASNNYELLHSDAIMEQKNERWEMVLYNRGKGTTDIDQTSPGDQHGGWSRDIFTNPR